MNRKDQKRDIILEILQSLVRDNGEILPEDVVKEAERSDSPLHKLFQWDNTVAGHLYRLNQARNIITYKFRVSGKRSQEFYNVAVTVSDMPVRGYFTKEKVLSDEEMYKRLLRDALSEIEYWQEKYKSLQELKGVVDIEAIETIKSSL